MNDAEAASTLQNPPHSPTKPNYVELQNTKHILHPAETTNDAVQLPLDGIHEDDDATSVKADSEAETIIQSGREELSPEKRRTHIQHRIEQIDRKDGAGGVSGAASLDTWKARKRKRKDNNDHHDDQPGGAVLPTLNMSRMSSPAPVKRERTEDPSPMSVSRASSLPRLESVRTDNQNDDKRKIRKIDSGGGDMETSTGDKRDCHFKSAKGSNLPHSRRISPGRSTSPIVLPPKILTTEPLRSPPPPQKRKKPPPPLTEQYRQISEDRESISSASSGSHYPTKRSRRLTSSENIPFSPIKQMQYKKLRDQNGRTRLARACAAQEVEAAKTRYDERPEDLNVPDNAGNTPLQIAALEGCAGIVEFLLNAGCDINTRNIDRDTPLIDAVENGHLEVVKLLLDAGANPRVGNAKGDEPYDLVPSDSENRDELRRVIGGAKTHGVRRRKSEDFSGQGPASAKDSRSRGASAASSQESPPINSARSPPPATGTIGRRRTVRSEATRNDLLWTRPTFENLRGFAAKGDMAGVATVLNMLQKADTESLIAAARGSHDEVLGILLGMGNPEPDPEPLGSYRAGYNTPMLAAIGRGNISVIKLLLDQRGFDPTRVDYRGRTYYELSQERKGDDWRSEHDLLKEAYDNHISKSSKHRRPENKSPLRSRDGHKIIKRSQRRESASPAAILRKTVAKSPDSHRQQEDLSKDARLRKEKKKGDTFLSSKEKLGLKTPQRDSAEDEHRVMPGDSNIPTDYKKSRPSLDSRNQPDTARPGHSEEPVKRRRLIAGRPPDRINARPSLKSSDSHSSREDTSKIKADQSNDGQRAEKGSGTTKRPRNSISPEPARPRNDHDESRDQQLKRRRIQSEDNSVQSRNETVRNKADMSLQPSKSQLQRKDIHTTKVDRGRLPTKAVNTEKRSRNDRDSMSADDRRRKSDPGATADVSMEDAVELKAKEAKKAEEHRELLAKAAKEARAAKEAEEAKKAANIAREKAKEEERKQEEARIQAEKAANLAREKAEEEERNREEERKQEEERKRKEVELRRIRQAEEERQKRLEQERLRQVRLRKEQEEQEHRRRDLLPKRLRVAANLIGSNDPRAKGHQWLRQFTPLMTAANSDIDPSSSDEAGDERWVPNFYVAPLLGTNDLQLSQYPSWEKRLVTRTQRNNIWRVCRNMLSYPEELNPLTATVGEVAQRIAELRPKYFGMEHLFWVKLSDFMDLVPHIPHLHGLPIPIKRMVIDPEPSLDTTGEPPQESKPDPSHLSNPNPNPNPNPKSESGANSPSVNGIIVPNGVSPSS